MTPLTQRITRAFPLWALGGSIAAYLAPQWFTPWTRIIPGLLGLAMLGMGLTLTWSSFRLVLTRPKVVLIGLAMQYLLMPALAVTVAALAGLPPELTAGMVLVGACPGGTASNVIAYLANASVALSVTLTALSTVLSVVLTPALTWLWVGERVEVPVVSMLWDISKIVLLPVSLGVVVNSRWGHRLGAIRSGFPMLSVAAVVLIIAIVVAANQPQLAEVGPIVLVAVAGHNLLGLASGYGIARLLRFSEAEQRTLAIEVGMQNSGLGAVLAHQHFGVLAALPAAVFSVWHNLSGSGLAAVWGSQPSNQSPVTSHQ